MEEEPFFRPFEGDNYRNPQPVFPRPLLIVGESYYLAESDKRPDFTITLMADVMKDLNMPGFKTPYYKNLFYVLTGEQHNRVSQERWQSVWHSCAFYIFVQSTRLSRPLMRPNNKEWHDGIEPLRTVLARLQPDLVLITGVDLLGHVSKMTRSAVDRPGVWLATDKDHGAYTRCIYHPSSRKFAATREKCREIVRELVK